MAQYIVGPDDKKLEDYILTIYPENIWYRDETIKNHDHIIDPRIKELLDRNNITVLFKSVFFDECREINVSDLTLIEFIASKAEYQRLIFRSVDEFLIFKLGIEHV